MRYARVVVMGLAALGLTALAVWTVWSPPNQASAVDPLNLGLDFNTSGTPADGVYNPASLPTFEPCAQVTVGGRDQHRPLRPERPRSPGL